MSQSRVFSIVGDSNVRNFINKTSCRANPLLKTAQVLSCGSIEIFRSSLEAVQEASNVVIVSCVTAFLASADGPDSVTRRIDPVLQDFRSALSDACSAHPNRSYTIAPPMYRTHPVWYREGLPEVLTQFSSALLPDAPPNLFLLQNFATPEFEDNGIHLTSYSGLEYVIHLFDAAQDSIDRQNLTDTEVIFQNCESNRVLEDRVMALEQDHRRLNKVVEKKTAINAEISDFRTNEKWEGWFIVSGFEKLSSDLVGKPWQDAAVRQVQEVIRLLMGKEMPIIVVQNATKRIPNAEVTYSVRMVELSDSKAIRNKFGSFFLGGGGVERRPPGLRHISIQNRVTPETRTRIAIMKLLAARYRDSNPGSRVKVIGYDPRPVMKVTPASNATDRRVRSYYYVDAVRKFPTNFTPEEITPILRRINPDLAGQIRSLFICLSDDQFRKVVAKRKADQASAKQDADRESETVSDPAPEPRETREHRDNRDSRSGRKSSTSTSTSSSSSGRGGVGRGGDGRDGRGGDGRDGRAAEAGHSRGGRGSKRGPDGPPADPAPEKR